MNAECICYNNFSNFFQSTNPQEIKHDFKKPFINSERIPIIHFSGSTSR